MADGHAHHLDDATLRHLVVALGPLAEIDSIGGKRGRSRDPREHPGSRGEQRDAAAALDAAHDCGALSSGRAAWERYVRLTPDAQATATWLAQRAGAVRLGAIVEVEAWAITYGRGHGPAEVRETAAHAEEQEKAARARFRLLRLAAARERLGPKLAADIDAARDREQNHGVRRRAADAVLLAWAVARFEVLVAEWRST